MHQAGLATGIVMLICVGSLSWAALYFLTQCSSMTHQRTFIGMFEIDMWDTYDDMAHDAGINIQ
jgi:amino acid permease